MKKILGCSVVIVAVFFLFAKIGFSHCQVPCGIYGDQMRFEMIKEDIATVEKSINEIARLSAEKDNTNYNQIVRWVNTKEDHANNIMKSANEYFLAQRIALPDNSKQKDKIYCQKVSLLHQIIVYAMKTKQSADISNVEKLKALVDEFHKVYFDKK